MSCKTSYKTAGLGLNSFTLHAYNTATQILAYTAIFLYFRDKYRTP